MKKQFLSKSVPRGTRTIWRYLGALFILFTFAIGNVWAAVIDLTPASDVSIANKKWKEVGGGYVSRNGSSTTVYTTGLVTGGQNTYVVFDVATPSTIEAKFINISTTAYSNKTICCGKVSTTQWTAVTNAASNDTQYQLSIASGDKLTDQTISLPNIQNSKTSCTFTATAAGKYAVYWTSGINNNVRLYEIEITATGGDADPVFTYTPATYTIGDDALDLSTKLTSTNTTGAITFAISTADDGSTGASIASNKNFTATTIGTAKVTVSQAASTGYNAKSQDIEVTVAAPDTKCFNMPLITSKPDDLASVTVTGGTLTDANAASKAIEFDAKGLKLGGSAARLKVTLSSATIVENTKITVTYECTSDKGSGIAIYNGDYAHKTMDESVSGKESGSWSHTFTAAEAANYADEFMIDRNGGGGTMIVRAITVEDCGPAVTKHTITLNYNDGVTPNGSLQVVDGNAATQPTDPTRGKYTFLGWNKGSSAYNWSAAVTEDFTLVAQWQDPWTITFNSDGGSEVADITVKHNTKAEKPTDPTKASHDFNGWYIGDTDTPFDWDANVTANYSLKAHWLENVAKYDIEYYDGTTKIGTEAQVRVDQHPTAAGISTDKPLYTFVGWYTSSTLEGDPVDLNTVTPSEGLKIYGKWAKTYANSVDFVQKITDDGTAGWKAYLEANNYYISSETGVSFDNNNAFDTGLKMKTTIGNTLSFTAAAGKVIDLTVGNISGMTIAINGGEASAITSGTDATHLAVSHYYAAGEQEVVLTETVTGYNIIRQITIRDPYQVSYNPHGADAIAAQYATPSVTLPTPANGTGIFKGWYDAETEGNKIGNAGASYTPTANITLHAQWETVSSDNTLSDLKVDGETIAGFDPEVNIYNLVYEYGQQPVITSATANAGALATVTINNTPVHYVDATHDFWYVQVKVEAESGAEKFYQVRYTNKLKKGVSIIKATVSGGDQSTGFEATGYYGGSGYAKLANNKKMNTNNYVGVKLAAGKTFSTGDILYVATVSPSSSGGSQIEIYAESEGTNLIWNTGQIDLTNGIALPAAFNGLDEFYIVRKTSEGAQAWNGLVDYVEVQHYMDPFIESFKIGEVAGTISGTNIAIELPYGTSLYGVAATIEAYANGGATVIAPTPLAYDTPLGYKVSSAYAEDGDVDYTVTITEADHYEAMIVGGANYETLATAVAAVQADDVVQLLDNVDLMATGLTIAENITLDLNGFNIKAGEQIDNDILVPAGKKLTLVDNSANAEGKIYTEQAYTGAVTGYGLIRVAGELLMQSGNIYAVIDSDPANLGQFAVVLGAGGKATIEGGQIKAGWYAISNNGNNTGSTIIVSGGELISTADFAIYNPAKESTVTVSGGVVYGAAGGIAMNRGELTVTGGTITSKDQGTTGTWGDGTGGMSNAAIAASGKYESVEVEISGGTIIAEGTAVMITNGTTNPVEVAISGGQFSHVVPAEYCAKDFIPVTTPNAQGKYEVIAAGIIRGAAVTNTDGVYYYTLDNGVTIYSSNSEGQLSTSTMTSTSSDVTACGGAEGGYNVNKSAFVLKFPVNVKEFTLYGANSTERTISKIYVNAEGSKTIKISTDGDELTGTYTNTKDGKCQALTAAFNDANIIPANYYVLVKLDGSVNFYRVLYTEAECTTPVINSIDATRMKVGEQATVSVDASAVGASYTWYRCADESGTNPQFIAEATKASYKFTKAAGNEYFKVVVGCNCSAETAEAIITAEEWYEVERVNVTGYTEWSWAGVYDDANAGPQINETQKGLVLASYIDAPNFNKLEGNNNAYVYRKNQYPAYQGTSLKFTTEIPGMLIIDASYQDSGNEITVNGNNLGALPKNHAADFKIAVPAGDVTITSAGMRIWAMKFDPDFSHYSVTDNHFNGYNRDVTEGRYGTICLPNGGIMVGAELFEIAYYGETSHKIFLDNIPSGEMVAGRPYIFLPKEGATQLAVFYTDEDNAPAGSHNGLIGFIGASADAYFYIPDGEGNYILQNNLYREVLAGGQARILSNRAYIKLSAINPSEPALAPGRRRVAMGVQSEQVATGCENLNVSDKPVKMIIDGQLFILRGEKMYDAKGQLVK